jgi:hypothetical protein
MSAKYFGSARIEWRLLEVIPGFACLLIFASVANSAVVPTFSLVSDPPGTPFLAPEASLDSSWQSYQFSIHSTAGEPIQAVDVRIQGALHQRWTDIDADGIPDPTPIGPVADGKGDSHFTSPGTAAYGLGPFENNSGIGSPLPDVPGLRDYGVGSILRGAYTIPGPAATQYDIAYVVVPRGTVSQLKFNVFAATPTGNILPPINSECPGSICTTPNIDVNGRDMDIASGDMTPSLLDGTDFGTVTKGSLQQHTFEVFSAGLGDLKMGVPTFTGPFSLASTFETSIPESLSRTFTARLNTSVPGTYIGSISISTNDPTAPQFNFKLSATVVPEPANIVLAAIAMMGYVGLVFGRRR